MVTSVARGRRVWLTLWRTSRRIWLKGRYYLLLGGATLLGCEQPAAGPMIVTQMAMVEGTEIIVTRIVRQTVQVPVTPVVMPQFCYDRGVHRKSWTMTIENLAPGIRQPDDT